MNETPRSALRQMAITHHVEDTAALGDAVLALLDENDTLSARLVEVERDAADIIYDLIAAHPQSTVGRDAAARGRSSSATSSHLSTSTSCTARGRA